MLSMEHVPVFKAQLGHGRTKKVGEVRFTRTHPF